MKLDLHGNTVHQGWKLFRRHVDECYHRGVRRFVVVTGHGQMRNEIHTWCQCHKYIQSIEPVKYNPGAWRITLTKKQSPVAPSEYEGSSDMSVLLNKLEDKFR